MTMMTAGRPEAYARCGAVLQAMAAKVYRSATAPARAAR
jgi:L-threonate 2-dehydrogenase